MMERAALDRPVFTVIGGPNEAGKSTYTEGLAARGYPLGEVVNPDVIAANLPGNPTPHPCLDRQRSDVQPRDDAFQERNSPHDAGGEKRWVYGQPVLRRCGFGRHFEGSCQAAC